MISRVLCVIGLLTSLALITQVSTHTNGEKDFENDIEPNTIYMNDDELLQQMRSIINTYKEKRADDDRYIVETDSSENTKFRTWKRNADFINALLALPKGMSEAGR